MSAQVIPFPKRSYDPEMTKRELAHMWRCSPRTIDRYMSADYMAPRGKPTIPHFTTPLRGVRFLLSEVEAWRRSAA